VVTLAAQRGQRCEPSSAVNQRSGTSHFKSYSTVDAPHLHVNSATLHGTDAWMTPYLTVRSAMLAGSDAACQRS
jgi:hypothetical protein